MCLHGTNRSFRDWLIVGFWLWMTLFAVAAFAQPPKLQKQNEELVKLLEGGDPKSVREAAEAIQKAPPKERDELLPVTEAVKSALATTRDRAAERELRLALGRLAAAGVEDAAEWGFESMSVTHDAKTPPAVFEAHVKALEMVPGAAKELMIGNLDVALNFPDAEPKERQRLKEFVTLTAEGMRTRELAVFLNELLTGEDDLFVKIEAPIEMRLLACYQNVKADPPINADAVVQWLEKHPGGPVEVDIAAIETITKVGTTKEGAVAKLAERRLAKPADAIVVARSLVVGKIDRGLLPQVKAAIERHERAGSTVELRRVLEELRKL